MRLTKLVFAGILIPFLGLCGCTESGPAKQASEKAYFDVPEFMQRQVAALNAEQPVLEKTVWVSRKKPETQRFQQVNWQEELQHFTEIDLNKKALAGAYAISEENTPGGKKTFYSRKPEVSAPVKLLEILYAPNGRVKEMRAVSEEKNALFYSREARVFTIGANNVVRGYQISGVQKVLFFDSLQYAAQAMLLPKGQ